MSNGDDVLDNWEEIDEAGINNTLQKIEAVRQTQKLQFNNLTRTNDDDDASYSYNCSSSTVSNTAISASVDFQPMKLLQRTPTRDSNSSNSSSSAALKSPLDDMAATFQPVMVLHKPTDEYQSANYTQPINSQTVKILRRPTQSSEPRNNGIKPRQPIKTLQQREQEYAEARLRILGAAKNPEDDVGTLIGGNLAIPASNSATSSPATGGNTPGIARANSASKIQIGVGPNIYNNHYPQQQQQQQQQQPQQQQQNFYFSQPVYNNRTLLATTTMAPLQHQHPHTAQTQTWSPVVGGSVSSPMLRQQQQLQQLQQQLQQPLPLQQQDSILRMPRGPDGSTGFQMRR